MRWDAWHHIHLLGIFVDVVIGNRKHNDQIGSYKGNLTFSWVTIENFVDLFPLRFFFYYLQIFEGWVTKIAFTSHFQQLRNFIHEIQEKRPAQHQTEATTSKVCWTRQPYVNEYVDKHWIKHLKNSKRTFLTGYDLLNETTEMIKVKPWPQTEWKYEPGGVADWRICVAHVLAIHVIGWPLLLNSWAE